MGYHNYPRRAATRLLAHLRLEGKGDYRSVDEAIRAGACTELDWCEMLEAARPTASQRQTATMGSAAPRRRVVEDYQADIVRALEACPEGTASADQLWNQLDITRSGFYQAVRELVSEGRVTTTPGKNGRQPCPMTIRLAQP